MNVHDEETPGEGPSHDGVIELGHWIEDSYVGDERFEIVELTEPGPLEGEDFRLRLAVKDEIHFFIAASSEEGHIRVGLALEAESASEAIEAAIEGEGESMNEFLADAMEADGELEYEMQHFHDDAYYFCSDLPYQSDDELASQAFRDTVVAYLEGYVEALLDLLESANGNER